MMHIMIIHMARMPVLLHNNMELLDSYALDAQIWIPFLCRAENYLVLQHQMFMPFFWGKYQCLKCEEPSKAQRRKKFKICAKHLVRFWGFRYSPPLPLCRLRGMITGFDCFYHLCSYVAMSYAYIKTCVVNDWARDVFELSRGRKHSATQLYDECVFVPTKNVHMTKMDTHAPLSSSSIGKRIETTRMRAPFFSMRSRHRKNASKRESGT